MKKIMALFAALMSCTATFAQSRVITIKEHQEMDLVNSLRYVSKEFVQGTVQFKDGSRNSAPLNIDIYNQATMFISTEKDTLAIINEKDIERISIGSRMFFKIKGVYVEIIDMADDVLLGVSRRLQLLDVEKTGAFGMPSTTSSVKSISTLYDSGKSFELSNYLRAKFKYEENPVFIYGGKSYPVSEKSFKKYFPKKKDAIEAYFSGNDIDIKDANQVKGLFRCLINN